jgi:2-C-methyl-D-erythritol 4-phosphate cytidylyltransferase
MKKQVIIAAGGTGQRIGQEMPKQFLLLAGRPMLMHTIGIFHSYSPDVIITVALPENAFEQWKTLCSLHHFGIGHRLVKGGQTRFHSVQNATRTIDGDGLVAVHDAARPLVNSETITRIYDAAAQHGNAVPVIEMNDSIREVSETASFPTDRTRFRIVQTPQCFRADLLIRAYRQDYREKFTDDATVVEAMGIRINLVPGDTGNIKITHLTDLLVAETLLKETGRK